MSLYDYIKLSPQLIGVISEYLKSEYSTDKIITEKTTINDFEFVKPFINNNDLKQMYNMVSILWRGRSTYALEEHIKKSCNLIGREFYINEWFGYYVCKCGKIRVTNTDNAWLCHHCGETRTNQQSLPNDTLDLVRQAQADVGKSYAELTES